MKKWKKKITKDKQKINKAKVFNCGLGQKDFFKLKKWSMVETGRPRCFRRLKRRWISRYWKKNSPPIALHCPCLYYKVENIKLDHGDLKLKLYVWHSERVRWIAWNSGLLYICRSLFGVLFSLSYPFSRAIFTVLSGFRPRMIFR